MHLFIFFFSFTPHNFAPHNFAPHNCDKTNFPIFFSIPKAEHIYNLLW